MRKKSKYTDVVLEVSKGDHRGLVADRQDWAKAAPVSILIVADETKFGSSDVRA